jgi:hypothetical protein
LYDCGNKERVSLFLTLPFIVEGGKGLRKDDEDAAAAAAACLATIKGLYQYTYTIRPRIMAADALPAVIPTISNIELLLLVAAAAPAATVGALVVGGAVVVGVLVVGGAVVVGACVVVGAEVVGAWVVVGV